MFVPLVDVCRTRIAVAGKAVVRLIIEELREIEWPAYSMMPYIKIIVKQHLRPQGVEKMTINLSSPGNKQPLINDQ